MTNNPSGEVKAAGIREELAGELRNIYGDALTEFNDFVLDAETLLASPAIARIRAEAWDEGVTVGWDSSGEGWNGEYPGDRYLDLPDEDREPNPYRTASIHSRPEGDDRG